MKITLLVILFAAVQNIDNFVVGAAYGLKNIYIGVRSNLLRFQQQQPARQC
jgi:putative Mn2+ efflux pump MntP